MAFLKRFGIMGLYLLATIQLVGAYLFLEFPYLNLDRFETGYERLPFQTRLLLAPLFRWAHNSTFMVHYASRLAMNGYFFPHGISPEQVVQFYLDIPCLLVAGWVAVRIYHAASRRQLLGWAVYPLFLILCAVSYVLHTVQNFAFVYDMPSLAMFAIGFYLIYFKKSPLLLAALFAVATLNRETTLLLLPFYVFSQALDHGRLNWRRALRPRVLAVVLPLTVYWAVWHLIVFHTFRNNASEYYPRIPFNLYCFTRLRYYPQLFSAFAFLLPFLFIFRNRIRDAQLRVWLWMIPVWYGFMFTWGILVETRVFGELLPLAACTAVVIAEELLAERILAGEIVEGRVSEAERPIHIARAA